MEKIVYDSLYKFLVSLGIVICVAPILLVLLFFNVEPTIISQEDYELLSEYSKSSLDIRQELVLFVTDHVKDIVIICWLLGALLILLGICNWTKVQRELDTELKLKNTKQMKELSDSERLEKIATEVNEDSDETPVGEQAERDSSKIDDKTTEKINYSSNYKISAMLNYAKIEDWQFEELSKELGRRYIVKKGIRAGRSEIDIVARSRKNNVDRLYEIKYYNRPYLSERIADFIIARMKRMAIDYETEYSRNTELYLIIYIPRKFKDGFEKRFREMLDTKKIEFPFEIEFHESDNIITNQ